MSMQSRFASLASLALFVTSFSISTYAADPMGSVVAVEGRPTAAGPSGSRALSAGSDVFEGDTKCNWMTVQNLLSVHRRV